MKSSKAGAGRGGPGIRKRLIGLVLVLVLPWIVLLALTYRSFLRDREIDASQRAAGYAQLVSARVDDRIGNVDAVLLALSRSISGSSDSVAHNEQLLSSIRTDLPAPFGTLYVFDTTGHYLGSSVRDPQHMREIDVHERQYFRRAMSQPGLAIGDPVASLHTRSWAISVARPVIRDGVTVAVISAGAELSRFGDLLLPAGIGDGSVVTLLDEHGIVLFRSLDPERLVGHDFSADSISRHLIATREGTSRSPGLDGVARISSWTTARRVPWVAGVGLPATSIGLAARDQLIVLIGAAAVFLVVALLLALWFANRIAAPLRALADDAVRLEAGGEMARLTVNAGGEIGALADAFHQMSDSLRRREMQLRASEERFRFAARATNDVIWELDIATGRLHTSDAVLPLLQLRARDERMSELAWWAKRAHPDDLPRVRQGANRAIESGQAIWTDESRLRRDDGSYATVLNRAYLVRDASERATRLIGSMHDVTARRAADAVLRESEQRYRQLFDANPIPMYVYDFETLAFLDVNEAAVRNYGYSRDEFLRMTLFDIRPPEDIPKLIAVARADRHVYAHNAVWRHRRRDGTILFVEIATHDIAVSGRSARLTIANDVTLQRQAERTLRETNDTLQTLVQASPLAIVTVDSDARVTEWNAAAERLFGWFAGDVLGRPAPLMLLDTRPGINDPFVVSDRSVTNDEVRVARQDRTPIDISISTALLLGPNGNVSGALWVMADVTQRKAIEIQLRQSQKMDAVGQLAGGVAHDFNNLLTVVSSYAQFVLGASAEDDPRHDDARQILHASERAAALTRQLLAFSRRQLIQATDIDLNGVIRDTEKLLRRLIGENIGLETTPAPDIGAVHADAGQIEQILLNLVLNARDAMPRGGSVHISTSSVTLHRASSRLHGDLPPGEYVAFAVRDDGVGMAAETQARIFEPFFTTKEIGKGTGLGLSTVYGIVRQSGGHILVESAPGQGTTMRVLLPRSGKIVPARPSGDLASVPTRGSELIVVVEDEDAVRGIARRILEGSGYRIVEARNGNEALAICSERHSEIDLLVTDVIMPGMSGTELAETLATKYPKLPVLFISGYVDDPARQQLGLQASDAFLAKPFTADALARRVRDLLDGRRETGG